jgi:hypothetical protein
MLGQFKAVVFLFLILCALSACGTFVPEIEEFWGSSDDVGIKVNAITSQVECELRESVRSLLAADAKIAKENRTKPQLTFLLDWSAQVTLTLTILESTALSPGVSLNTVLPNETKTFGRTVVTIPQSFSLGLGGTGSSAATRTDTLTALYKLSDFAHEPPVAGRTCIPPQTNGFLFIQSDLKLKQWLYQAFFPQFTNVVQFPSTANANVKNGFITHDVKFQIVSSGNATPSWKLVQVTANSVSPFFNTARDRTQDLLITLGPTQAGTPPKGAPALATAAQNAHLAQLIGQAVAAAIAGPPTPPALIPPLIPTTPTGP